MEWSLKQQEEARFWNLQNKISLQCDISFILLKASITAWSTHLLFLFIQKYLADGQADSFNRNAVDKLYL